ncbi:hypothetical protein ACIQMV_38800 [Streptomyces sp. NPDC091412]|uniref:hypothetical protein n=1 Tax=Streptomyces sp. NPDC091412 TaxID=3366002 RepID=UPI00381D7B85
MSTPSRGRQPGRPQLPFQPQAPEPPRKKSKGKTCAGAGCLGVVGLLVIAGAITAATGGRSSSGTARSPAAASPDAGNASKASASQSAPRKEAPQTVTYVVTGTSGAVVQYGPAGSLARGTVPMSVTRPLEDPQHYAITAQLQGGGHVTCRLKVNGRVISQSTASGGHTIASCEISKDTFSDKWTRF